MILDPQPRPAEASTAVVTTLLNGEAEFRKHPTVVSPLRRLPPGEMS